MDRRRSELAKIHIARRDLDLADDTYRALLHERYQARSSADLQPGQRADLLQHFKRLGRQKLFGHPGGGRGGQRVHADIVARAFKRQNVHQADDTHLSRAVIRLAEIAVEARR